MDAHGTPHLTAQLQAKNGLVNGKGDYFLQLCTLWRARQTPEDSSNTKATQKALVKAGGTQIKQKNMSLGKRLVGNGTWIGKGGR